MSGVKHSEVEIDEKVREQLELQNEISILNSEIVSLKKEVRNVLNNLPKGMKEYCFDNIKEIENWLNRDISTNLSNLTTKEMKDLKKSLKKNKKNGKNYLSIIDNKKRESEKIRMKLKNKLNDIEKTVVVMGDLLNKWKYGKYEDLTEEIKNLNSKIENYNFENIEKQLNSLEKEIGEIKEEISKLEEQEKKNFFLTEIDDISKKIKKIKEEMKTLLDKIPETFYGSNKEKINSWIQAVENMELNNLEGKSSEELKKIANELTKNHEEGKNILFNFIDKINKKKEELTNKLNNMNNTVVVMGDLLKKWKYGKYEDLTKKINNLNSKIENYNFENIEKQLNSLEKEIGEIKEEISKLEEQDKKRNYVLPKLIETCEELGWKLEDKPKLENSNDHKSSIVFKVNTKGLGTIKFFLSLEGIKTNSPLENEICYANFDEISKKLKEYGIITKFKTKNDDEPYPELKQKQESDIPISEGSDDYFSYGG